MSSGADRNIRWKSGGANTAVTTQLLTDLFNQLFMETYNTRLEGGGEEPVYLPANNSCRYHRLIFRSDYVSSAFHEIAHWCIAGDARRQLVDFGYWYNPDGRSASEQKVFENVEIKPQALEWMLSVAANHTFHISADNLSAGMGASNEFVQAVVAQARSWCRSPLPKRAAILASALSNLFSTSPLEPAHYRMDYHVS